MRTSLVTAKPDGELYVIRSRDLLETLVQAFFGLESVNKALASPGGPFASCPNGIFDLSAYIDTVRVSWSRFALGEHWGAHETVKAARSVASLMRGRVNKLEEALCKTSPEVVQIDPLQDQPSLLPIFGAVPPRDHPVEPARRLSMSDPELLTYTGQI
ncbi:Serine/threonine-protein kinase smg1 [Sarracenia purpurea var. burkii]